MRNSGLEEKNLTRARNAAYGLLTYRPRSRKELEDKLREKEFSDGVIVSVIDHCAQLGYLDDTRFASQWASSRVRHRGFGRRRIEQELRGKGISRDTIHEVMDGVFEDSSEADIARREVEKKLRSLSRFEPETRRRRLAGFLERKGFSSEIIRAILRDCR